MTDRPRDPDSDHSGSGSGEQTLATLEANGVSLATLTDEQRQVLGGLSADELALLIDIKTRLDEAGPEVQAHSEIAGGALF